MPKRIFRYWLAAAVLALCGTVQAATLSVGQASGTAGDLGITLPISLASAAGESVSGIQFDLLFDSSVLSVSQVATGAAADAAGKSASYSVVASGQIRVIIAGLNQNVIGDGVVATASLGIATSAATSTQEVSFSGALLASPSGQAVTVTTQNGSIIIDAASVTHHSSDYNPADWRISLSELLRAIQLYHSGAYSCNASSEDGYVPGAGLDDCTPHDSDYNPQDWRISLSELLRLVQFFNMGAYHVQTGTEDGFEGGT